MRVIQGLRLCRTDTGRFVFTHYRELAWVAKRCQSPRLKLAAGLTGVLDMRTVMDIEARIPTLRAAREQNAGVHYNIRGLSVFAEAEQTLRWCISGLVDSLVSAIDHLGRPILYRDRDLIVEASPLKITAIVKFAATLSVPRRKSDHARFC